MRVAGADGCRAGWFVVIQDLETGTVSHHVAATFAEVVEVCGLGDGAQLPAAAVDAGASVGAAAAVEAAAATAEGPAVEVLGLDMPIGLMDTAEKGGRPVDRAVRERLKPHRASSVFSPPCRPALVCDTYEDALAATRANSPTDRGLTLQSFGLFPKLREVDGLMTPDLHQKVREVHPELCFAVMNSGRPLEISKQKPEGQEMRIALLAAAGFEISKKTVKRWAQAGVGRTDIIDAYAVCWTAGRIARGEAERLPADPGCDARGLRMELWV